MFKKLGGESTSEGQKNYLKKLLTIGGLFVIGACFGLVSFATIPEFRNFCINTAEIGAVSMFVFATTCNLLSRRDRNKITSKTA